MEETGQPKPVPQLSPWRSYGVQLGNFAVSADRCARHANRGPPPLDTLLSLVLTTSLAINTLDWEGRATFATGRSLQVSCERFAGLVRNGASGVAKCCGVGADWPRNLAVRVAAVEAVFESDDYDF